MARPMIEEYRAQLRGLSNEDLVARTSREILGAAVMARFRNNDGWADDCADACYDEAVRRGNVDLYQRAYNSAVRSQGHDGLVSDGNDADRARRSDARSRSSRTGGTMNHTDRHELIDICYEHGWRLRTKEATVWRDEAEAIVEAEGTEITGRAATVEEACRKVIDMLRGAKVIA